jgi:hypothetical protein
MLLTSLLSCNIFIVNAFEDPPSSFFVKVNYFKIVPREKRLFDEDEVF